MIALVTVLGSLLLVSIVSRLTSTLSQGNADIGENAAQAETAEVTPANQLAAPAMPAPTSAATQQQNGPQQITGDPAAPAFDPQPTLDTSGISVGGSDLPSSDGQAASGETLPAASTGGVDPAPGQ